MKGDRNGVVSRKSNSKRRLRRPDHSRKISAAKKNGARFKLHSHKRELDHIVQRYAELYDLAPTGYVSFDRSGRIEEINLTAAQLFRMPRERLIGMPFMVLVSREDTTLFLHHLLRCRCSDDRVETELRLKTVKHKIIHAVLSSIPVTASIHNGALLYQTAIIDLTERKLAEEARSEAMLLRGTLYELSQRYQDAKSLSEIYQAALDAILKAVRCERASILLYDQQQVMRFVAWRGLSEKYRKAVEGHSPWKPDTKNPQPVCIPDVNLADIPKSLKSTIRSEGICAAAFIPLVSSQTLIGKFMAYHDAPHVFTDAELKLVNTIAAQLAQAIEHKRGEEALYGSEERLRAIVQQANAGMARYDLKGRIEFVNSRFCKMLGYLESELIGKTIYEITHPDDVARTRRALTRVVRKGDSTEIDKRYICKDGSVVWVNVCDAPERDAADRTKSIVAVAVDITARKKAEAALEKSHQLLETRVRERTNDLRVANKELEDEIKRRKGLEGEILEVSDREQQRLAQELHDGLCQHLTAVAFMARSVALRLKNHRVIDAADLEKISELVNNAATDTRNISQALHRVDVDGPGFVGALEDLVDREMWRTPCRLEVKPSFHLENDTAAAHLYRIAREAVINANKHAEAREIVVAVKGWRKGIVLSVTDDGIGFQNVQNSGRGLGFHIMNYRAQLMGGQLKIESPKKGGTCVACYLPDGTLRSHTGKKRRPERLSAKLTKALTALI